MARPKKIKEEYLAKIRVLGRYYTSSGVSVSDAINKLGPIGVAKGVSILAITKGTITLEKILASRQIFRLFNGSRLMKEIALKNISNLFGGL